MSRSEALAQLRDTQHAPVWDFLIIGGGATGLGAAVDAASRGFSTLLVEARDFASGTSSRSTKLIHGGIRYMRNGDFRLVRDALRERTRLLANAPHLVHPQPFIIPAFNPLDRVLHAGALKLYDALAGWHNLESSTLLSREEVIDALPGIRTRGLCGGIRYWDGQFDDTRLAISLMRTAEEHGALCLNYLPVTGLEKHRGKIVGAQLRDAETGEGFYVRARCIINATGVHADAVRRLDEPQSTPILTPSQGIHLVFDADLLPGRNALLVPETEDGRVVFAIPWHGKVLVGTTDTAIADFHPERDPQPMEEEIDFLLRTIGSELTRTPTRADIRSAFAGLRPLLHPDHDTRLTASLSREHAVLVAPSGLITVTGGKWTTYRLMAEQVINRAIRINGLRAAPCCTAELKLHGASTLASSYGKDEAALQATPGADTPLHPALPYTEAMVRYAFRHEAARSIEDILARRTRALFLDAAAAQTCIPRVAEIIAEELAPPPERLQSMIAEAEESARRFSVI